MPKQKAVASFSGQVDSGAEEEIKDGGPDTLLTPDSNQESAAPAKPGRKAGRPRAVKATSSRLSGSSGVAKKKPFSRKKATNKKTVTKEPIVEQPVSNPEENGAEEEQVQQKSDEAEIAASMDELVTKEQPIKRGRKVRKQPEAEPVQPANATENDGEFEYTPTIIRSNKLSKHAAAGRRKPSVEPQHGSKSIPETQEVPMELDPSPFHEEDEFVDDAIPQSVFRRSNNNTSYSGKPRPFISTRRAGSASDTEKAAGDSELRRRLVDMTRRFEELDKRYKTLKEVGIKEAQINFEKLKDQTEAKTKAADDFILSLKKEIATQSSLAQESRSLHQRLKASDSALSQAQAQVTQLTTSLSEAQNENKALQAKLANSRSASVAVESVHTRTPGSALRAKPYGRTIMVGSAEAAQAAQVALLKEDLYSDLTGLILRGVERRDEADIYDCIQTGRNGTLHFHLSVATDTDAKIHYEDTTFTYTPRLDANRDRDLLELLPDYLSEEIAFSRLNAAKFYGRVVDTLMKKREEGPE